MAAQITPLPSVPSRQDPTNFNDRADAFLGALPTFQSEANVLSTEVNTRADDVQASHTAVLAATNITKWVSGTTYSEGAVVWSPINGLGYRRITASGSGTTDPSLDATNYKQVNGTGDVSTSGNQTIAGVKTFTSGIALGVDLPVADGGTGASTALAAFDNIKQSAGTSYAGVVSFATTGQAQSGALDNVVMSPATTREALNSGSDTAPMFAAKAWVNFNGTGVVAIRASGNVSSITDNGIGKYTVNFTTDMSNNNYAVLGIATSASSGAAGVAVLAESLASSSSYSTKTVSAVQVLCTDNNADSLVDSFSANVTIFC